jgi:hypothetical protein
MSKLYEITDSTVVEVSDCMIVVEVDGIVVSTLSTALSLPVVQEAIKIKHKNIFNFTLLY